MKTTLEFGVLYSATIGNLGFGPLDQETLIRQFSDGRVCGRMIEPLLAEVFDDFECSVGGNSWDLKRKSNGLITEVKTLTKNGCNLIPSCQIGAGRKYDQKEYHNYIKKNELFFIVDIRHFPKINIVAFPGDLILEKYPGTLASKPIVGTDIMVAQKTINLGELIPPFIQK